MVQIGDGLQQIAVPLARNELPGRGDDTRVLRHGKLGAHLRAIGRLRELLGIDRAADNLDAPLVDAVFAQHSRYGLRDRDDLTKWPVAQRGQQAHLGIIDSSRDDGGNIRKTRRHTAQHVCAATAVAMHEIRLQLLEVLREAISERQIEIARTEQVLHANT